VTIAGATALLAIGLCAAGMRSPLLFSPGHGFARWTENVPAGSDLEKALYGLMQVPGGEILFPRPPREAVPALTALQQAEKTAALYSLRALEEEQALDFASAERDWKTWTEQAEDHAGATLDLADFYERRLKPQDELAALDRVGQSAPDPRERWTAVESQRSWKAFERALKVVNEYGLPRSESARIYSAWMKRYPQEPVVYADQFAFLLEGKEFAAASELIARYRNAFPADRIFPVKAEADLAVRRGSAKDGLAIYDARFEPLWPPELIKNYFDLVLHSHNQRAFGDALRAKLSADTEDLKDAARLFYLYQQQGQLDSAKAVLTRFREQKEARGTEWTAGQLDTLERLFEAIQDFPEAARYAYALAADRSSDLSERKGVIALTRILLTAPEQPLRVGAGNLALYKSIATMDRGPGYLNGILSLFLNTQGPADEYATEDQLAVPYFHRARAAELLKEIDRRFPDDPARPQLHAALMEAYGVYGENDAEIREGTAILAQFPHYSGRVSVALELADAYERTRQIDKEFSIYQDLLKELAAQADGVPLGSAGPEYSKAVDSEAAPAVLATKKAGNDNNAEDAGAAPSSDAAAKPAPGVRSAQYAQVLDRYLARLASLHRLPDALAVLRGELDRNPQDPGLYEKLAGFLEQNALNSHEEEVYQSAIQQFQDTGWYSKLARFYIRQRRNADYGELMHKVTAIFSGTEVETFLEQAPAPDNSLATQVNLYAYEHFPHNLHFAERLIAEYSRAHRQSDLEKLLWEHWWESPDLRDRLFELLSRTGRLNAQLELLRQQSPEMDKADWNGLATRDPAAERFWLEACLWQSHFEQGVGAADALASAYPADIALGEQSSSLYRSLAYFHPEDTDKAIGIQKRLLDAQPGNLDTLARIGDIYADRGRFGEAAPYWVRMAEVHAGEADGYLQSATVFWDYFDFASAQAQLERARVHLNQPALFGYQEGAIEESRGDLAAAIRDYTASAATDDPSQESRDHLLALARRAPLQAQVEQGTAGLLKQSSPTAAAIQLRAGILQAEHRTGDLGRDLDEAIATTGSFDVLEAISATARSHSLGDVEESALRRQIALTTDPVHKLQLRYQLVDLLQNRNASGAVQEVDAIYRENGKILGVVRSTVDYDWAHDRKQQAVAVLLESAQASYPDLKSRFELEAARKLTDLGEFARSRVLLNTLLGEKPLDASYESAIADNLAHANDQTGLEAFYRTQLELVKKADLEHQEKLQRIGQLRRGMIGAATLLGNFNDAVDQYIELINAYPEDAGLAQEASLYAVTHGARDRLFAFYQKTVNDSPRDPRWSIVLARLGESAEDYPLAIDAYGKALRLRPERQDLYIAQASLEERLRRFDDAIALYRKLYTLSYRDPKWMERVAELCARQGKDDDAVKALETAWTEGRPPKAANSFAVAARLESWGLLDDARRFAEQGVQQAGADLLMTEQSGAATYARILARQRLSAAAYARLAEARDLAPKITILGVAQQVVKAGPAAVSSEEWRTQREAERRTQATLGFAQAMKSMGNTAREFYTPEEKSAFAAMLKQNFSAAGVEELRAVYLPAVKAAGLADLTADATWEIARHSGNLGGPELNAWIQLEKQRVQMDSAGAQLERLASVIPTENRSLVLDDAVHAYQDAGDSVGELRVTDRLSESEKLEGDALMRYYRLLLAQRPQDVIRRASAEDSAAQYLVRNGRADQALAGISARAEVRPPVWKSAYTGLTGLYLRVYRPDINTAFSAALNADASIGDRVAHPADRNQQLAGAVWFYYGSRYGEYLDDEKDERAQDYLESELEHTPADAETYLRLASYSADAGRTEAALGDFRHSLDLNTDQPAVLDRIATIDWERGQHAEALIAWNEAVKRLAAEMDARHVPETFWGDFTRVIGSIHTHGEYEQVRQPVEAMLRIYIARNGDYRVEPLLEAGYHANQDSAEWLLAITASAPDQQSVLYSILPNRWSQQGTWIRQDQISRILERIVELEQHKAQTNGNEFDESLFSARERYVAALVQEKNFSRARAVLAQVPEARRNTAQWLPSVLAAAEGEGALNQLLASWKQDPRTSPADNDLLHATGGLSEKGRRAVQRFVYKRALNRRELTAVNFLGLASIDLDENDTSGAVALLKRLTLVSANPDADSDSAAQLLEERNKESEALEFLRPLSEATPWNAGYKVRLAKAMLAVDPRQNDALSILNSVAGDRIAKYRERVAAALALKGHGAPASGSEELKLLAKNDCPSMENASKPYFVEARAIASTCISGIKTKEHLLRDALATDPSNGGLRLRYIWSAFEDGFDSRGLVAAEPYLQNAYVYGDGYVGADDEETESDDTPSPSSPDVGGNEEEQAPSFAALTPGDRDRLLQFAAAAYERRHDYANASKMVSLSLAVVHDAKRRKSLGEKRKHLELELARTQENDARAPNIRGELDQDRIVRPRVLSGMPVPPQPAREEQE
jgi:Flp pilus assembly protein TadD